jgi:hypothetical protein
MKTINKMSAGHAKMIPILCATQASSDQTVPVRWQVRTVSSHVGQLCRNVPRLGSHTCWG